jgi:hypothetical protein
MVDGDETAASPGEAAPGGPEDAGATPPGQASGPAAPGPQVKAWADDLSDYVVEGVGWVKARTTVPVMTVLRALVYGLVIVVALLVAGVLGVIGVERLWDAYFPISPEGRRVWLGYVVLGGVLFAGGALLVALRGTDKGQTDKG